MCKFILRTFKSRDKELLMTLFNSLVRRDELSFERLRHLISVSIIYSIKRRRERYIIVQIWILENLETTRHQVRVSLHCQSSDLALNADALKQLRLHTFTPSSLTNIAHLVLP